MSRKISETCSHMQDVYSSISDTFKMELKNVQCATCLNSGPNIWICLHENCFQTGCSEQVNDHSTEHFKINNNHCIHMNLSSQRVWCYLCENEIFLPRQRSYLGIDANKFLNENFDSYTNGLIETNENKYFDRRSTQGLVGLQNISNTCYMNAALQAISNIPQLTRYFLDCGDIIGELYEPKKIALSRSYYKFVKDLWGEETENKDYIVPRGILYNIRSVYPMFRGYQQHDSQEFLRCFMDQLHEELKETPPSSPESNKRRSLYECNDEPEYCSSLSPSQSEAEYETCDSGVSEPSSSFDKSLISKNHQRVQRYRSSSMSSNQHFSTVCNGIASKNQFKSNCLEGEVSLSEQSQRSIISDVFDGKLLSSVQCLTCDRISIKEETFQDLSLPIPNKDHLAVLHQNQSSSMIIPSNINQYLQIGTSYSDLNKYNSDSWLWWIWNYVRAWFYGPSVTLHDCLASFFSADELKGDNMYSCDKCNKLRNGIKYSRVLDLPEILCVHLKRFRHDLSYSSKISSYINFPLKDLDMRPYMHKECKSLISTYDLVSVICHHGTVGGGHYTSYAKHEPSGKWFEFDDQHVNEVTPETVQNCQAYVLFYRKSNPQISIIRSQARELSNLNPLQNSDIHFFVSRQWISRFNTFAEPGPIDNWSILCPHGGLPPAKVPLINQLAVPLPQYLWEFLFKKHGGGPACNRLYACDICKRTVELIARRQKTELEIFSKYNDDFQYDDEPKIIYAISMSWFRQWQLFARGLTNKDPGPINNSSIVSPSDTTPFRNVRPGSDYAQLNMVLWRFFYEIYGGGPEIILRGSPPPVEEDKLYLKSLEPVEFSHNRKHSLSANTKLCPIDRHPSNSISPETTNENKQNKAKNVTFDDNIEVPFKICTTKIENKAEPISTVNSTKLNSTKSKKSYKVSKQGNIKKNRISNRTNYDVLNRNGHKHKAAMKSTGLFGVDGTYYPQANENGKLENITSAVKDQNDDTYESKNCVYLDKQDNKTEIQKQININKSSESRNELNSDCNTNKPVVHCTQNTVEHFSESNYASNKGHKIYRKKVKSKNGRKSQTTVHYSSNGSDTS